MNAWMFVSTPDEDGEYTCDAFLTKRQKDVFALDDRVYIGVYREDGLAIMAVVLNLVEGEGNGGLNLRYHVDPVAHSKRAGEDVVPVGPWQDMVKHGAPVPDGYERGTYLSFPVEMCPLITAPRRRLNFYRFDERAMLAAIEDYWFEHGTNDPATGKFVRPRIKELLPPEGEVWHD